MTTLAVGSVLAACAAHPRRPPVVVGPLGAEQGEALRRPAAPPPDECGVDADCVATDFTDCCACCPCARAPYAAPHARVHAEEARCGSVTCTAACDADRCPPCAPSAGVAVCDHGTCRMR